MTLKDLLLETVLDLLKKSIFHVITHAVASKLTIFLMSMHNLSILVLRFSEFIANVGQLLLKCLYRL